MRSAPTTTAASPPAADDQTSTRLFLAVVTAAVFMTTSTGSMLNVVLPVIRLEFGATPAQIGLTVTGYALGYAVGVPLYGRISDFFGIRRIFVIGLIGFALGGLLCAVASNLPVLVTGRTMQGIGGAAVPALASVAVAKLLPPGRRGGALGLVASTVGVGSAAGPVIGGTVGQSFGWRALFAVSLVLMLLIIPFARRVLPATREPGARRFDLLGGALLGLAAGLFLFGITQGQAAGFGDVTAWGCFLAATVAAAAFGWRITTAAQPFVAPALFRNRGYVAALGVGFFVMMANLATLVLTPLLLIEVNGLTPGAAGLVLTPGAVAVALLAPVAGRLSDRFPSRWLLLGALAVIALAYLYLSTFAAGASPVRVSLGMLGLGIGMAFMQPVASNAAANALPENALGSGMGIFSGAFFLGAGAGPALLGAFLAARLDAGGGALNPAYGLGAAPFSDAYFVVLAAVLAAALCALGVGAAPGAPVTRAAPVRAGGPRPAEH